MTMDELMTLSTGTKNNAYANIMERQPVFDKKRTPLMTHVLYECLLRDNDKPSIKPKHPALAVKEDEDNLVCVVAATLNLATATTWNAPHPSASCLIRHVRTFELARALDDLALDASGDVPMSDGERHAAIQAAHALMSYTDDWLEEKIGRRPFARFHKTDEDLLDTASTHLTRIEKLIEKNGGTGDPRWAPDFIKQLQGMRFE